MTVGATDSRRSLRDPYAVACAVLVALYLWPIWVTPFVPFTDLHAHLSIVAIMRNLAEAGQLPAQTFEWGSFPLPNSFYYVVVYLLSFVFGLTLANQIFLSLYVLAFPFAFTRYLHAFGRDRRLVLFALPLTYHWSLFFGFIDYSVGLVFSLWALAAAQRYCSERRRRHAIVVALWAILLFFTHLQVFFIFLYLVAFIFLLHPLDPERAAAGRPAIFARWRRFITVLPAMSLCAVWIFRHVVDPAPGTSHRFGTFGDLGAQYDDWLVRIEKFPTFVLDIFRDGEDTKTLLVLAALAVAAVVARWYAARSAAPTKRSTVQYLPEVLLGGTVALYFALPMHIRGQELIYCRLAALACMIAVATLHGRARSAHGLGTKMVLVLVISAAGYHAYNIRRHVEGWARELGPFEEVMRAVPRGTRLIHMTRYEGSAHINFAQMRHLNQYHLIYNGGTTQSSFASSSGRIIRYRSGQPAFSYYRWIARWGRYHRRWATDPELARHFQYVLTHGIEARSTRGFWRLVFQRGRWALYLSSSGK